MMFRLCVLTLTLFGSVLIACVGGSVTKCIPDGTSIAVARSGGSGACPAPVVAGVTSFTQTFTPQKDLACGVTHFNLNVTFTEHDANNDSCQGSDVLMFQDLGSDGGSGTDTMAITCADGTACSESFDVTFTAAD